MYFKKLLISGCAGSLFLRRLFSCSELGLPFSSIVCDFIVVASLVEHRL